MVDQSVKKRIKKQTPNQQKQTPKKQLQTPDLQISD